jgi:methyltransferase (TIGR00027 family)
MHRAAHQVVERGSVFLDPLAVRIAGADADTLLREAEAEPACRKMRLFIAARSRFAEDALANSFRDGTRQLVILGAGLDTYAWRGTLRDRLRIFEVDHPATQQWKRDRLMTLGIDIPPSLTFAPVDFERQTLAQGLDGAGFDRDSRAFFTWLGVVPYLSEQAVWSTLRYVAALSGGAEIVFDYSEPTESLSPEMRAQREQRAARLAALGEALIVTFRPDELRNGLLATGYTAVEDLGLTEIAARYFGRVLPPGRSGGGHIVRAGTSVPL